MRNWLKLCSVLCLCFVISAGTPAYAANETPDLISFSSGKEDLKGDAAGNEPLSIEDIFLFETVNEGENEIDDTVSCTMINKTGEYPIKLHQRYAHIKNDRYEMFADGSLQFMPLEEYIAHETIPEADFDGQIQIKVTYDRSVDFRCSLSVYLRTDDGLRGAQKTEDLRKLAGGEYLFDVHFNVDRGEEYCSCDALLWLCF